MLFLFYMRFIDFMLDILYVPSYIVSFQIFLFILLLQIIDVLHFQFDE